MNIWKQLVLILFFFFSVSSLWGEEFRDSVELKLSVPPVFGIEYETIMVPIKGAQKWNLLKPSLNDLESGKDLGGVIALGTLVAPRGKDNQILPLQSEYKVLLRVKCMSNRAKAYILTQELDSPLVGETTGEEFPEGALVSQAFYRDTESSKGKLILQEETSIFSGVSQLIYESAVADGAYLGNILDIYYWVSSEQENKVTVDQKADTYRSTLIITMMEP